MNPVTIRKEIEIAAPASQVWRYIGTAAGLRQWWGVDLILEERTGGYCEERGVRTGQPYQLVGEVTLYEPPHRLALTLHTRGAHDDWPTRTQVEITLEETIAHTKVFIVHHAFAVELAPSAISVPSAFGNPAQGPVMALPGYRAAPNHVLTPLLPLTSLAALQSWQQLQTACWQRAAVALQTLLATATTPEVYP